MALHSKYHTPFIQIETETNMLQKPRLAKAITLITKTLNLSTSGPANDFLYV